MKTFAKEHWVAILIVLGIGAWYWTYANKSYTRYIALRDAALKTQGSNPYVWTWLPFGPGNPFTY